MLLSVMSCILIILTAALYTVLTISHVPFLLMAIIRMLRTALLETLISFQATLLYDLPYLSVGYIFFLILPPAPH